MPVALRRPCGAASGYPGWRRTMPDAVHGTSARMRSNGLPSHQSVAPASPALSARAAIAAAAGFRRCACKRLRIAVQRQQVDVGAFQQVAGLAARRGAGIQHAHAILHVQQRRGQLRGRVLHRHQALVKAGICAAPAPAAAGAPRPARPGAPRMPAAEQGPDRSATSVLRRFTRKVSGGMARCRLRGCPASCAGYARARRVDPPLRIIPLRFRFAQRSCRPARRARAGNGAARALTMPSHAQVSACGAGSGDGLVDDGEGVVRRPSPSAGVEQRQRASQQRQQQRRLRRLAGHRLHQRVGAAELAHRAIGYVLHGAARLRTGLHGIAGARQGLGQGGAVAHQGSAARAAPSRLKARESCLEWSSGHGLMEKRKRKRSTSPCGCAVQTKSGDCSGRGPPRAASWPHRPAEDAPDHGLLLLLRCTQHFQQRIGARGEAHDLRRFMVVVVVVVA